MIFLEFPYGCQHYRGPHSPACVVTIWREVGCVDDGWKHPSNLTTEQWDILNNMDLRLVIVKKQRKYPLQFNLLKCELKHFYQKINFIN